MRSSRMRVIPNGADPLPLAGPVGVDRSLVVSLGRLERYKGHHYGIKAIALLGKTDPALRLRIVGSGPYEGELVKLASRLGVADRVTIGPIDQRDRQDMGRLLASAGAVLLLSEYEAHPIAVMEALSMGRPVIVSDVAGSRDLVRQGLVRPISVHPRPGEIAREIHRAVQMPSTPGITLPTWSACVDALLAIYTRSHTAPRSTRSTRDGCV